MEQGRHALWTSKNQYKEDFNESSVNGPETQLPFPSKSVSLKLNKWESICGRLGTEGSGGTLA